MDVNGFMYRIDQAKLLQSPDKKDKLYLVRDIDFKNLAEAFKTHPNWKGLQDEGSEFSKFVKNTCEENGKICTFLIRVIGILWCNGKAIEKAEELYNCMQDNGVLEIACNDRDFKPNLFKLLDMATCCMFE